MWSTGIFICKVNWECMPSHTSPASPFEGAECTTANTRDDSSTVLCQWTASGTRFLTCRFCSLDLTAGKNRHVVKVVSSEICTCRLGHQTALSVVFHLKPMFGPNVKPTATTFDLLSRAQASEYMGPSPCSALQWTRVFPGPSAGDAASPVSLRARLLEEELAIFRQLALHGARREELVENSGKMDKVGGKKTPCRAWCQNSAFLSLQSLEVEDKNKTPRGAWRRKPAFLRPATKSVAYPSHERLEARARRAQWAAKTFTLYGDLAGIVGFAVLDNEPFRRDLKMSRSSGGQIY